MTKEVEMKYRLKKFTPIFEGKKIKQGYLNFADEEVAWEIGIIFGREVLESIKEARVRQKGEGEEALHYLTLKSDGTMEREEYEIIIEPERFERLWTKTSEGRVEKTRYKIEFDNGLCSEIDVYEGNLEGLLTMEFEFDPEKNSIETVEKTASVIDDEAENVTEVKAYKNRNLAKMESISQLEEAIQKEIEEKMWKEGDGAGPRLS